MSRDARPGTSTAPATRTSTVAREWAAAGAGCALADTVFNPLDVLKVRAQQSGASARALALDAIARDGLVRGLMDVVHGVSHRDVRDAATAATGDDGDGVGVRVLAGGLTGAVGALVFNPIDVVRVRMQSMTCAHANTIAAFGDVARREGVAGGLWRGTGACVARAMTLSGSQLATYDVGKRWLLRHGYFSEDAPPLHFTASFVSGVVAQTVTQPVDTLKTLVMSVPSGAGERKGAFVVARDLVAAHGVRGLYRGFVAAAARQGPVMVIQMPIVEALRKVLGLGTFGS
ncbi:Mitochondrial substrate/solute carrier [Ostreococcus tauri]|uniref:Mitochondrial substrate/solute carrier n=1 Tax=Ostreococcus tauri TaxID=70448 RepID=A0A096PAN1_OSTTA|nr:Mitochondrial substrate/solute carrier [Ostreococcus tauri]CEG01778.1 Mitochondrial substrate/solute carrier [Ostreococcus tauri]|eukprot:XP_022841163.1 Mitochondrial substrate/solute carrier [Ostreococcus tauri]